MGGRILYEREGRVRSSEVTEDGGRKGFRNIW